MFTSNVPYESFSHVAESIVHVRFVWKIIVEVNQYVYNEKAITMGWSCFTYALGKITKENVNLLGQIEKAQRLSEIYIW